jgi:DNA-binding MarR family transcriptional regulator
VVFAEETRQAGLTPRQYAVLVSVADNKDVSQTGLVAATGIDRSTLADIVKRLLAKGLIQRRRTRHDARAYAVRLTDEGRELLHSIAEAVERADARLLAGLSAQSRDQLMTALTELARAAPAPR